MTDSVRDPWQSAEVDPTARTLRLLSFLQGRRDWSGADLADRLGVSVRTLRRDVERLRELGYPVEAQPGVDGGYRLAAGASLPPLVLDDDEAVALTLGLQAAAAGAVAGMAEPSVRALTKVGPGLPARLRRRVDAFAGDDRARAALDGRRAGGRPAAAHRRRPGLPGDPPA